MLKSGLRKMEPWDKKTRIVSILNRIEKDVRKKKWKKLLKSLRRRRKGSE